MEQQARNGGTSVGESNAQVQEAQGAETGGEGLRELIAALDQAAQGCWEVEVPEGGGVPAPLTDAVRRLLESMRRTCADTRNLLSSLASANVRMALLNDAVSRLRESDKLLQGGESAERFYGQVLTDLMDLTRARYGALALFDERGEVRDFLTRGVSEEEKRAIGRLPTGRGLLGAFYREGKVTRVDHISRDPRACGFPPGHPPMESLLGVPLRVDEQIKGVIYLADKDGGRPFSRDDEVLVEMFAVEVAHAIERTELLRRLEAEKNEQQRLVQKLHEAHDQLLQSEKLASIGQLAAGVAHEINNPVGYINSNLGTLQKYTQDLFRVLEAYEAAEPFLESNPEVLERIRAVMQEVDLDFLKEDVPALMAESLEGVKRVKQIVQDLKDFSHVDEAGWQWADLHKGLDSTLNIVHNELKYKAEVVKEYGDLPEVECLPSQLNQVFMNLLVNAAQAIEERGVITVRTGVEGDWVWVEVEDTGKGIPKEHLKRIFDPFFTTKPVGKGTGLGLSLSYGIVNKHGGRIEVESEVGKGTRFRVWLPVRQSKPRAEQAAEQGA